MQRVTNQISDSTILNFIRENNLSGWDQLYDKYAPIMYGIICTHTADKRLADEILINLFIRLKSEEVLLNINATSCVSILRYTYINTRKALQKRGINYTESPNVGYPTLHIFCSEQTTVKQVADRLNLSKQEIKQLLHQEFLLLRSHNEASQPPREKETLKERLLDYHSKSVN